MLVKIAFKWIKIIIVLFLSCWERTLVFQILIAEFYIFVKVLTYRMIRLQNTYLRSHHILRFVYLRNLTTLVMHYLSCIIHITEQIGLIIFSKFWCIFSRIIWGCCREFMDHNLGRWRACCILFNNWISISFWVWTYQFLLSCDNLIDSLFEGYFLLVAVL